MLKTFICIASILTLIAFSNMVFAAEQNTVCNNGQALVNKISKTITVLQEKSVEGYCEILGVDTHGRVVVLYHKNGIAFPGPMFKNGVAVEEPYKEFETKYAPELVKKHEEKVQAILKELPGVVITRYSPAKATKYLYLVTDPDCPFCERAKGNLKKIADKLNFEIRVVWFPLPMHPNAKGKTIVAICNRISYEQYLNNEYKEETCKGKDKTEAENTLQKSIALIDKMGINGTPTLINDKGQMVAGVEEANIMELLK